MCTKNRHPLGILAIVAASVIWGTTGTAASFTGDVSPLATGAFAMGFGGVLLVITSLRALHKDAATLVSNYKLLFIGGLAVGVYPLAFYSSMRLSGVAIGSVVSLASAPLFTVILEYLIDKKPISKQWLMSFTVAGVGMTMLAKGKLNSGAYDLHSLDHCWGILASLFAGLSYALYSWAGKNLIDNGVSSKSAMSGMFGLAAILLLPSLLWTGQNLFTGTSNVVIALYMAVVPMFLGYVLFGYGLRSVLASQATLITLLEPVIATVLAVVIVGERYSVVGWFGVVLILSGLLLQVISKSSTSNSDS